MCSSEAAASPSKGTAGAHLSDHAGGDVGQKDLVQEQCVIQKKEARRNYQGLKLSDKQKAVKSQNTKLLKQA